MPDGQNAADGRKQQATSTPDGGGKMTLFDKSLTTTANLVRLLPTGTTLVFQTLVPSFTNHGMCYPVNRVLSWGLVGFLFSVCAFLPFTDSITIDDKAYYGLALPNDFYVFNNKRTKNKDDPFNQVCKDRKMKPGDFVHALFSAFTFLALAFNDAELQTCMLGSRMTEQWKEFLVNMPLAIGLLDSFVFMIFPSTRKGIGYDVGAASAHVDSAKHDKKKDDEHAASAHDHDKNNSDPAVDPPGNKNAPQNSGQTSSALTKNSLQIAVAGDRVAPSTSYELDSVV